MEQTGRFLLALGVGSLLLPHCQAQRPVIREITIDSTWAGLESSAESSLSYSRSGGQLLLEGRELDPRREAVLVTALQTRPVDEADTFRSRFPQMWLDRNAEWAARRLGLAVKPDCKSVFQAKFRNRDLVDRLFLSHLRGIFLDNDRSVVVTIRFEDGTTWVARSYSSSYYMLPWRVDRGEGEIETFDVNISKAIGELIPAGTVNRWVLLGEDVVERLASDVHMVVVSGDGLSPRPDRNAACE